MPAVDLARLIAESRVLRAERLDARDAFVRRSSDCLHQGSCEAVPIEEMRVIRMTALLLEAHRIALQDEEGSTIDLITDALAYLNRRLEQEVLPRYAGRQPPA